jgi:hypothetical protein
MAYMAIDIRQLELLSVRGGTAVAWLLATRVPGGKCRDRFGCRRTAHSLQ